MQKNDKECKKEPVPRIASPIKGTGSSFQARHEYAVELVNY